MISKNKYIYLAGAAVCVAAILGTCYAFFLSPFSSKGHTTYLYIDDDDDIDSVDAKIDTLGKWYTYTGFNTLVRHSQYPDNIKTGKYAVSTEESTLTLFRKLKNGIQTPTALTVPSVRTLDKLATALAKQLMADSAAIADILHDSQTIERLGFNTQTMPSLFIPNTYEVYWNIAPSSLIMRLHREHKAFWNAGRQAKANALKLTTNQVATLASIVDEETANNSEKPIIAGLYYNRLQRGMLLQADPTVKYALGDFTLRRIYNRMLTVDSPYNTYRYKGLPPGPIRIPTVAAIDAVLNMQHHNYLYMCAKEDLSGTHNYAATLAEHQQNARRYAQALNARGIR